MGFFRKYFKLISSLSVIALVVMALLYYLKSRSYSESFERKFSHRKTTPTPSFSKTLALETEKPTPVIEKTISQANTQAELKLFKQKWIELMEEVEKGLRHCNEARERLLADRNLIDPAYSFYQVSDRVISTYDQVFHETLLVPEIGHATALLNEAFEKGLPLPAEEYYAYVQKLAQCTERGAKTFAFIDTVFSSLSTQLWTSEKKSDLKRLTLGYITTLLEMNHLPVSNLAVAINLLDKLHSVGLLSFDYQPELDDLKEKVIESERFEREFLSLDAREGVKREMLLQQWQTNQYLAGEIAEMAKRALNQQRGRP